MLRKIATTIVLVPLVVLLVGFAVANRQIVSVSFDPFDQAHPAYALTLPLFGIVFVLMIVGVIIGGIATWFRQGHWRRRARALDGEVRALRGENEALRSQISSAPAQNEQVPPRMLPPTA
ncbi:MAG: LapA family protein [Pseudolabrys sp.]|nr:LapA family protein [Pseudolabrys sp.]MBV9260464.1 LapA family protein [Pseudolabrys sp.]